MTEKTSIFQRPLWVTLFALTAAIAWGWAYPLIKFGFTEFGITETMTGSKILFACLGDEEYRMLMRYERYGMFLLLFLVWSDVLSNPLNNLTTRLFYRLFFVAEWAFELTKGLL